MFASKRIFKLATVSLALSGSIALAERTGSVEPVYQFDLQLIVVTGSGVKFLPNGSGDDPAAVTFGNDGALYGTTYLGGPNSVGGVFRITTGGDETLIHPFTTDDGFTYSTGNLTLGLDGNFYGTTSASGSGPSRGGEIFRVEPSGSFTVLKRLSCTTCDSTDTNATGYQPMGALYRDREGSLFGATFSGGKFGLGTIFKLDAKLNYTVLVDFTPEFGSPWGSLAEGNDGLLYGVSYGNGATVPSVIFRLSTGGAFKILATLNTGAAGYTTNSGLTLARDGNFYGTTQAGGRYGNGAVFRFNPKTNAVSVVAELNDPITGSSPFGSLVEGHDGLLYGTCSYGGVSAPTGTFNPNGTVFRVDPVRDSITTLYVFPNYANMSLTGSGPQGTLALGKDGVLYGISIDGANVTGGGLGSGAVWKYVP